MKKTNREDVQDMSHDPIQDLARRMMDEQVVRV